MSKYDFALDLEADNSLKWIIEDIPEISQCRVVYEVIGHPLVSIIIPSKDNPALLK